MTGALAYLGLFAVMAAVFAGVVASRPPRGLKQGLIAAAAVLVFFAVLAWSLVRFLFSALEQA